MGDECEVSASASECECRTSLWRRRSGPDEATTGMREHFAASPTLTPRFATVAL